MKVKLGIHIRNGDRLFRRGETVDAEDLGLPDERLQEFQRRHLVEVVSDEPPPPDAVVTSREEMIDGDL